MSCRHGSQRASEIAFTMIFLAISTDSPLLVHGLVVKAVRLKLIIIRSKTLIGHYLETKTSARTGPRRSASLSSSTVLNSRSGRSFKRQCRRVLSDNLSLKTRKTKLAGRAEGSQLTTSKPCPVHVLCFEPAEPRAASRQVSPGSGSVEHRLDQTSQSSQ